mgnify:FL=1
MLVVRLSALLSDERVKQLNYDVEGSRAFGVHVFEAGMAAVGEAEQCLEAHFLVAQNQYEFDYLSLHWRSPPLRYDLVEHALVRGVKYQRDSEALRKRFRARTDVPFGVTGPKRFVVVKRDVRN